MGWMFWGYAAVFGSPDRDLDIFAHGCFAGFVRHPAVLEIPMFNGHVGPSIGRWHKIVEDGFGLLVIGELNEELGEILPPYCGLSVTPVNSQGSPFPNAWGGKVCRITDLSEISLVAQPAHHGARILGPWRNP